MKQTYDNATIKVWFTSGASRNFYYVAKLERIEDTVTIRTTGNALYIVNWTNVTMVEEVE